MTRSPVILTPENMLLVPSISVIKGRTTRLSQGDYSNEKIYNVSPLEVAEQFADHGVTRIHLIDLEGAQKGKIVNYHTLELITGHTDLKVNFTGGIHTDGDILKAFEFGAESISAATIALYHKELFSNWIMSYGRNKIALSADTLDGHIRVGGWQRDTKVKTLDHIRFFYDRGLKYLKTTDIARDGVLEGPALELYQNLRNEFPELSIFACGGVRNIHDIYKLQEMGIYGVIFGRAFYEGKISLKEIEHFIAQQKS